MFLIVSGFEPILSDVSKLVKRMLKALLVLVLLEGWQKVSSIALRQNSAAQGNAALKGLGFTATQKQRQGGLYFLGLTGLGKKLNERTSLLFQMIYVTWNGSGAIGNGL